MLGWLKRIWGDPVWSKVIAVAIVAVAGGAFTHWYQPLAKVWQDHPAAHPWIVCGAVILLFATGILASATKTRVDASMTIVVDAVANAPWISLSVHNRSLKRVRIAAVEFKTVNHWDIPNLGFIGSARPTANFIESHTELVEISPDRNSISRLNIGKPVRGRALFNKEFRLTTRHSPAEGAGLFPFHLEAALIYGGSNSRLQLQDLVVSLNGVMPTSGVELAGPINISLHPPGELTNNAHQALRLIDQGACAHRKTTEALRAFTRR